MKKILLFAITTLMLSCGNEVENQDGYKGAVKSVTATKYATVESSGNITTGDIIAISEQEYDESGYLVRTHYTEGGEFQHDYRKTYDKAQRLITVVGKNEYNHTIYREDYEYNSNGDEISCKVWDIDTGIENLRIHTIHEYDQNNNCVSKNTYIPDGSLIRKTAWAYTNNICVKCSKYYDSNLEEETIYDEESGNVLKITKYYTEYVIPIQHKYIKYEVKYNYDESGKEISRTSLGYDDPGDCLLVNKNISQSFFASSKIVDFIDENGLCIKQEYTCYEDYSSGEDIKWLATEIHTYDEHKNRIETTSKFSYKGEHVYVYKTAYKYDDKGNWVEKIETSSKNANDNTITIRSFSYYK